MSARPAARATSDVGATEDGVAVWFAERNKDGLRWDPDREGWLVWNGSRWAPDRDGAALERARDVLRVVAEGTGKAKWLSHRAVKAIEALARTDRRLVAPPDAWDRDPWLLGTPGGVVDLRTGGPHPCRPADGITKATAVEPAAGEPTRWLGFLREAAGGDLDLVAFVRRMCGYALTGDTSEQCLFFLYGPGRNGKSVFINTVSGILGDYVAVATMDTLVAADLRHSTDLAMLRGARLVSAVETDEGKPWAEARIKQMTGRDKITARFVHRDNFTYRPEFKLLVVGNHKPSLASVDEAIRRRFNVLPFVAQPCERDPRLEEALRREWPRILAWMIEGCIEWQAEGLRSPRSVLNETAEYFEEQDMLGQWIEENCVLDHKQWELGQKAYDSYCRFLEHAGERKIGRKTFAQAMRKRGYPPDRTTLRNGSTIRVVRGLYLTSEGPKGAGR